MDGRLPPLRPGQGALHRPRRRARAGGGADDPVLLARREAEHDPAVVTRPIRSTSSPRPSASSTARAAPAGYGPPYNHNSDGQHIAFIYLQKWLGVSHPIDTAKDFVIAPLRTITGQPGAAGRGRRPTRRRPASSRRPGPTRYTRRRSRKAKRRPRAARSPCRAGDYGPVPVDDELAARVRAGRRARRRAADQQAVLPDRLHQAAAVHGRRRVLANRAAGRASARRSVGDDERDRQLSRASRGCGSTRSGTRSSRSRRRPTPTSW